VRLRASRLWSDLVSARAQVQASQIQVSAAELARRGAVAEQNFGLRSTIEALNQELELRQARIAAAAAKRDLYVAMIDIMALLGRSIDGAPASSLDPARRTALPPPAPPRPGLIERPLITVQEFFEAKDKPLSRAMLDLNQALEPRQKQGPPL
jgi:Outer membrane efflux protein